MPAGAADGGLFFSQDPALNANKQVVFHILRDLLEANHWELADRYIAQEYRQHNPNAADGRAAVVAYFTEVLKVRPSDIPDRLHTPVIAVLAEGDLVTVLHPRRVRDGGSEYHTTWFDTWRIRDGKAVEHWDPALLHESPELQ